MRQILNVIIPKSWQELPDKELRFVFRLLQGEYSLTQIKTLCLLPYGLLPLCKSRANEFALLLLHSSVAAYKKPFICCEGR